MNKPSHFCLSSHLLRLLIGGAVFVTALILARLPLVQTFERQIYDLGVRLVQKSSPPVSEDIIIIAIDDESLQRMDRAIGRWPWPRVLYAGIVNHCAEARAIGFDILLPEGEPQHVADDADFITEVTRCGHVISSVYLESDKLQMQHPQILDAYDLDAAHIPEPDRIPTFSAALTPYPKLLEASHRIGHTNKDYDPDGVLRRYSLVLRQDERILPSLALAMFLEGRGLEDNAIHLDESGHFSAGGQDLRCGRDGSFLYSPSAGSYRTLRFVDVLESWSAEQHGQSARYPRELFKDKLVLIGSVATGLPGDEVVTPIRAGIPGVWVHATALDNLLHGQAFVPLPAWVGWLVALCFSLLVSWLIPDLRPLYALMLLGCLSLLHLASWHAVMLLSSHLLPVMLPLLSVLISGAITETLSWATERKRRNELEAVEAAKQRFTDMLVHDLKGQLGAIVTSVSMLGDADSYSKDIKTQLFDSMKISSNRMLTQVSALLDIRKIEEGRLPVHKHPVHLNELLSAIVKEYHPAAQLLSLELVHLPDEAADQPTQLDPEIFERIMGNLIWNAIQYARAPSTIEVSSSSRPGETIIWVGNAGRLLSPEQTSTVFLPFTESVAESQNTRSVSTGLGLTFCKLAVESHGGTIRMISPWQKTGDGVRVEFTLPY